MQVINKSQFSKLINSDKVTVVDFFAVWCGPCKMMHPVLQSAEKKYPNITFAQVDIDQETELAIKQNVSAVPTIIAYKNGKEVKRTLGYNPESEFELFLSTLK